jgi:hypothetical protein
MIQNSSECARIRRSDKSDEKYSLKKEEVSEVNLTKKNG